MNIPCWFSGSRSHITVEGEQRTVNNCKMFKLWKLRDMKDIRIEQNSNINLFWITLFLLPYLELWGCRCYFSSRAIAQVLRWNKSRSSHSWSSSPSRLLNEADSKSTSARSSQYQVARFCCSTLQKSSSGKILVCLWLLLFGCWEPASNICLPRTDPLLTPYISMQHRCHWSALNGFYIGTLEQLLNPFSCTCNILPFSFSCP